MPPKKRSRDESQEAKSSEQDSAIYELIKSKERSGVSKTDIKASLNLPETQIVKALTSLCAKGLVREVKGARRGLKHYVAAGFEPSEEITGGSWFTDGAIDTEFVSTVSSIVADQVRKLGVATAEDLHETFQRVNLFKSGVSLQQVQQVLTVLKMDGRIEEVRSTGTGISASVMRGKVCYRCCPAREASAAASVPCLVCPRIRDCTPDGIISPRNCVYYQKWLNF
ncbi:hypothetical protein QJS04_geneDACA016143 [Acorus gramineus]|uniref:DNA-directed RNA polymerase III subunit RPC6 n=1 Tax=Acorus gramineus TaxID=55184 RepID=A0AAV9AMZ0_ACOGR|nr:hypothetical protein QJS04_geneDACA016143 [Acorus gramineus]